MRSFCSGVSMFWIGGVRKLVKRDAGRLAPVHALTTGSPGTAWAVVASSMASAVTPAARADVAAPLLAAARIMRSIMTSSPLSGYG